MIFAKMPTASPRCPLRLASAAFGLIAFSALAQQVPPRALPVEDEAPVPKAIPVPTPPKAQPVLDDSSVRPAPPRTKGPDDDMFDFATLAYERQEWEIAVQGYSKYLQKFPTGRQVPDALYRIGECYMKQNQLKQAESYYAEVVTRYPDSEGAPSAAYRLGATTFNESKFTESARYFAFCEAKHKSAQVKLAAAYNKSRAHEMMGDKDQQAAALKTVIAFKTENPYRETALLTLGSMFLTQDKKTEALPIFEDLVNTSADRAIVAEASIRAAVLFAELKKPDESILMFEKTLRMPETNEQNRGIALIGIIQALFVKGDYDAVIDYYNKNSEVLPPGASRAKMLVLVGHAYRMRKSYARAVEIYLLVEQYHPDTEEAFDAGYWKLYCFYLLNDRDLGEFATAFIAMEQKDPKATVTAFETLLKKYPTTTASAQAYYGIGRGNFDQKLYDKTVPALRRAIEIDSSDYLEKSSQLIILCDYARQNANDLAKTIDSYLAAKSGGQVPPNILKWLGLKLYSGEDFKRTARFLELAVTPQNPENTEPVVWNYLGMAQLQNAQFDASIQATDNFLKSNPDAAATARAQLTKGRALLGKGSFDEADKVAQEALQVVKDGKLQAELLILEGDIFSAQGDQLAATGQQEAAMEKWKAGAAKYAVPSQFYEDPDVTPDALFKASQALQKSGDEAQAKQMLKQLQQRYPKYQPKK